MPTLLTVPETAEALRLSVKTIYQYTQTGRLPSVRYSGGKARTLIPADAVEAFIAAHTRPAHGGGA